MIEDAFYVPIYTDTGDEFLDGHPHKHLYNNMELTIVYLKGSQVDIFKR